MIQRVELQAKWTQPWAQKGKRQTTEVYSQALKPNVCLARFLNCLVLVTLAFHFLLFWTVMYITGILYSSHNCIFKANTLFSTSTSPGMNRNFATMYHIQSLILPNFDDFCDIWDFWTDKTWMRFWTWCCKCDETLEDSGMEGKYFACEMDMTLWGPKGILW